MKLCAISDLHVDVNGFDETLRCVAQEVRERGADILLIPGDVSCHHLTTLRFIRELREVCGVPLYWVPGNHDIWNRDCPEINTPAILEEYRKDEGYVEGGPVKLREGWSLIGHLGWYDYTLGDLKFSYDELKARKHGDRTWQDSLYATFGMSDAEVHASAMHTLRQAKERAGGDRLLLMTHMVSHRRFTVPRHPDAPQWLYFNAFLGSLALFELAGEPGIEVIVCGHVHHRTRFTEKGKEYICCCLSEAGEFPRFGVEGLRENIRQAIQDIII